MIKIVNQISSKLLMAILIIEAGFFASYFAYAQVSPPSASSANITFPVAELNNCKSETECRAYCNDPQNIDACVDFAQKHGFISQEEAAKAKQFKDVIQSGGPGGCKTQDQCESYCNAPSRMDECVSFAEKHNLMSADELSQAKKVAQALKQGAQLPGNCRGKEECESYCKDPAHAAECLDFAAKAGIVPPDQVDQARKMLQLVQSGDAPQACLAGKEQCQAYCSDQAHRDQCANFMVKAGFMKPDDAAIFKKTGGKGPGGCQGKDECQAFCNAPENQETCFKFGEENGLIPPEQLQQIKENMQKTKEAVDNAPPEVKQCLQSVLPSDTIQKIESGNFFPTQESGQKLGEQMGQCFQKFLPKQGFPPQGQPGQGGENVPPPANSQFRGPGGCSSPEECAKYCSDPAHISECESFNDGGGGGQMPPGNQPGGEPYRPPLSPGMQMTPPMSPFPGQPLPSFNPQMPLQSIQGTPPPNTEPYPGGQVAPATQQPQATFIYPSSEIQPSAYPTPAPAPSSLISRFLGEILRFITGPGM